MTPVDMAAVAFGGQVIRLVKARENEVYEIKVGPGRAALRLHREGYQSESAIRSELWWCEALAVRGVPVPMPVRTAEGDSLVRLPDGRISSALHWLRGAPMGEAGVGLEGTVKTQAALHRKVGDLVARVHEETARLVLPAGFERPVLDLDGLLGAQPRWGRFWEHPALTDEDVPCLVAARDLLRRRLAAHAATEPLSLIHADVLRENVLVDGDDPALLDFDDAAWGYAGYDLGTVLSQSLSEPALPHLAAALVEGYAARRPLDVAMVPVFTLMRCCASVGWTVPRVPAGHPVIRSHINRATGLARTLLDGRAPW